MPSTDRPGYFGAYGGRFIPETLSLPSTSWPRPTTRPGSTRVSLAAQRSAHELRRSRDPALFRGAADHPRGRRADLPQARRSQSHGRAQDQQRDRPGPAREASRESAHHRGDGSGPARRRHRHRVRSPRPSLPRVHGRSRRGPPAAERAADGAARRGGHPRRLRKPHPQGCDQRGHASVGHRRA